MDQDDVDKRINNALAGRDLITNRCNCGCCHVHDNGACPKFEAGANGRCVYCDHGEACHERDKGNQYFNTPLGYGERLSDGKTKSHMPKIIRAK